MTDWAKLTVAVLKGECASRGIPLTGLKLKQQYIDILNKHEAENEDETNNAKPASQEEDQATPVGHLDASPSATDNNEQVAGKSEPPGQGQVLGQKVLGDDAQVNDDSQEPHDQVVLEDSKAEPKEKDLTDSTDASAAKDTEDNEPPALPKENGHTEKENKATEESKLLELQSEPAEDRLSLPKSTNIETKLETREEVPMDGVNKGQTDEAEQFTIRETEPVQSDRSTPLPASDALEDQRRRRKRSASPAPTTQDMARKKARLSNEADDTRSDQVAALREMKAATEVAKEIRNESDEAIIESANEHIAVPTEPIPQHDKSDLADARPIDTKPSPPASPRRSPSPSEERDVPPAIHPATSSLYIRNFKRPLHIPSLRGHIVSLAKSRRSPDDSDPINVFYLDNIRTHAYISFKSVSAASRVRTAMHGTRFPDENMREPLFVDYIPDDKVQTWIDQETGGGFGGGRGAGRRYEVVYEGGSSGVEAVFQEIDANRPQQRPPTEPRMNSRMSIDRPVAAGVPPDRATIVPRASERGDRFARDGRGEVPPTGLRKSETSGRGFKALDELFKSTSAKPKLYYKPVPEAIANERFDRIRDLLVGHSDMGRSGDEGMKRYTFERYKDREEWVDKGPEFGYGKRGQDRLAGIRGRGGYRGRGGDSWRGGGGR